MKFGLIIVILLLGHLLGDFVFQPKTVEKGRIGDDSSILKSGLTYAAGILLPLLFYVDYGFILPILFIVLSHVIIKTLSVWFLKKRSGSENRNFVLGQVLQLLIMIFASRWILSMPALLLSSAPVPHLNGLGNALDFWIRSVIPAIGLEQVLRLSLLAIVLSVTSNVFIKLFLSRFSTEVTKPGLTDAGQVIGTLERFLVAFFVMIQQYAAIGLVFTAKSIARYNRISENPEFAEYYLVGSLLSVLTAVIATIFIFQVY